MNDEEAIFNEALALPSTRERSAFVDQACRGDAELRRRIEVLLAAHDNVGSFLDSPPADVIAPTLEGDALPQPTAECPGEMVGPYKLLEQIGEGGMGVVFMAEQQSPVRRRVALKIIKPGMDTRQVLARFDAERQALALMDHSNIARVLEAGATEAGRPYFVMEFIRGVPITHYCDQENLSLRQRLDLFVQVCQAVQHAHQKGIIHRDLKPNNVLVTLQDGKPSPKIIDFGIAKATAGQQLTDQTLFTELRQLVGTPLYMSPEQAEMSALMDTDTRSDVYSLGVLLYELLTGTTPFDKARLARAAWDELRRIIREEEPPRPSTRISTLGETLSSVSARRQSDPKKLSAVIRGELDWIVMRALEKDRTRRYGTASGLAQDVERYLADQPVEACPPSRIYQLRKMARRNQGAIATVAALCVVLLVSTGISAWQAVLAKTAASVAVVETKRANEEARRAQSEAARADIEAKRAGKEAAKQEAINRFFNDMLSRANPRGPTTGPAAAARVRGRSVTVLDVINEAVQKLDAGSMKDHPEVETELRITMAEVYRGIAEIDPAVNQLRIALRLNQEVYGVGSIQAERVMLRLGGFLAGTGDRQALPYLRQVLAAQRARGKVEIYTLIASASALLPYRKYVEAEKLCREALAMGAPLDENNGLCFMRILLNLGKLPEAEEVGRTFLAAMRSDPAKDDESLAIRLGAFASVLLAKGDLDGADKALKEATILHHKMLDKPPRVPVYWNTLYRLREAQGNDDEAEAVFRQWIETWQVAEDTRANRISGNVILYTARYGSVLYEHRKYELAEATHRQALADWRMQARESDASTQDIVATLAWDLEEQGNQRAAQAVWQDTAERLRAELVNPKSPHAAATISLLLVNPLVHLGQWADAKTMARQGLNSNNSEELNQAAWVLVKDRKPTPDSELLALAMQMSTRAVGMDPDNPNLLNTLGVVCYRAGDFAGAVTHLENSIALQGKGGYSDLFFMAMALERQGQHAAAVSWWDKAVDLMDRVMPRYTPALSLRSEAAEVLRQPN